MKLVFQIIKKHLRSISINNEYAQKSLSKAYYLFKNNSKKILGKNNLIDINAFLDHVTIDIIGNNNQVMISKGAKISKTKIIIRGSNHKLIIENNCNMKSGVLVFEDDGCEIVIGKNTTIVEASIAVTEPNSKIEIGEDCMISFGVDIRNGDSHSIISLKDGKRINYAKNVLIENHVWIGAHVQVLKGVKIGANSIVGVRSLVTKEIPSNCIAVGTPAMVVKNGITWDRKRIYE